MTIYDDAKTLFGISSEIKRLISKIEKMDASFDLLRNRITEIEKRLDRNEIEALHQNEKTVLGVKLAVTEASARFEGDVRERLVSLDLRLKSLELITQDQSSAKKLPSA